MHIRLMARTTPLRAFGSIRKRPCWITQAHAIAFPKRFSREAAKTPGSNAGKTPLGLLPKRRKPFDWDGDCEPVHTHDTVIYELHVRGLHPAGKLRG